MKIRLFLAVLTAALSFPAASAYAAGQWVLAEDQKNWIYAYSPNDWAKNEWIEDGGKIYYVDGSGYMKTGWVTDQEDGKRYYMGDDGAMRFNTFASDGRYVGPEGSGLPLYDDYRKKAKEILSQDQKDLDGGSGGFLLSDLNEDGYKDLVVAAGQEGRLQPTRIAVWDSQEKEFVDCALFDPQDTQRQRFLYQVPGDGETVLTIKWMDGDMQVFRLDGRKFECQRDLELKPDSWGGREFLSDGVQISLEDWQSERQAVLLEQSKYTPFSYLPLSESAGAETVDQILTPEEAALWED